jgi:hypothetical protein
LYLCGVWAKRISGGGYASKHRDKQDLLPGGNLKSDRAAAREGSIVEVRLEVNVTELPVNLID